jgi:hypothetical protein
MSGTYCSGRYDAVPLHRADSAVVISQTRTAWDLKLVWPEIELHIVPDAGHSAEEVGTKALLVDAADRFRTGKAS